MRKTAVGAGLLAALVVFSIAFGGALAADGTQAQTNATQGENGTAANASFGAEVSSFMQASSAETEGNVEGGMFHAALNRTNDTEERRAIVEARIDELEARHDRLADRRASLGNGSSNVRQFAIAAHVMVGAQNLQRSINETDRAAADAGVDRQRLDELRTNASALTGQEVADIARGLAGPVENPGKSGNRGPPEDNPGANASADGPGNSNASDGGGADAGNKSAGSGGADDQPGGSGSADGGGADPGNDGGGPGNGGADPANGNDGSDPGGDAGQ